MSPVISANNPPVSIDELDVAIVSCAAHINAATYELLLLVSCVGALAIAPSGWPGVVT